MNFFEILLTVIGIFLLVGLLKFFFRFVLPIIIQMRALRRAQRDFFEQAGRTSARGGVSREGEVTVDRSPKQKTIIRDEVGETVDYEEVE